MNYDGYITFSLCIHIKIAFNSSYSKQILSFVQSQIKYSQKGSWFNGYIGCKNQLLMFNYESKIIEIST